MMLSFGYSIIRILSQIVLLAIPVVMAIVALVQIKNRPIEEVAKAIWVAIILVPFGGAVAFWIVQPGSGVRTGVESNS